jgi:hypothetical protein
MIFLELPDHESERIRFLLRKLAIIDILMGLLENQKNLNIG